MRVWFLKGFFIRLSYQDFFKMMGFFPLTWRIFATAFIAGSVNPYNWMLQSDILFVPTYLVAAVTLIWICYSSLFQLFCLVASFFHKKFIPEPVVMFLAFLLAYPAVFWICQYLPYYSEPIDIKILALSHLFAFVFVQMALNFYLIGFLEKNLGHILSQDGPSFLYTPKKEGFYINDHSVKFSDLLWIRSEGHNLRIKLVDGEIVTRAPLEKVTAMLTQIDGLLIHRSSWINRNAANKIERRFRSAVMITMDGMAHAIARAKFNDAKLWIAGELDTTHQEQSEGSLIPIRFLFFKDHRSTLMDFLTAILERDNLISVGFVAVLVLLLNPLHLTFQVPLSFWAIFWFGSVLTLYMIYPGIMTLTAVLVRVLDGKSVWELPVMIGAHLVTWAVMSPIAHTLADSMNFEFSYSMIGTVFNIMASEVLVNLLKLRWNSKLADKPDDSAEQINVEKAVAKTAHKPSVELQFFILDRGFYVNDVLYVQSDGHYLRVHEKSGQAFLLGKLSTLFDQVPETYAVSPHRSYWIMRHAIASVQQGEGRLKIKMKDGHEINVARGKLAEMRSWLKDQNIHIAKIKGD